MHMNAFRSHEGTSCLSCVEPASRSAARVASSFPVATTTTNLQVRGQGHVHRGVGQKSDRPPGRRSLHPIPGPQVCTQHVSGLSVLELHDESWLLFQVIEVGWCSVDDRADRVAPVVLADIQEPFDYFLCCQGDLRSFLTPRGCKDGISYLHSSCWSG